MWPPKYLLCKQVRNQTNYLPRLFWGSYLRVQVVSKVGYNFVAHNLDTEFALFEVQTWEIWRRGRAANQENLDDAEFMKTKFASSQRKISCKASWSTTQGPQGHKYNPLGT
jgi:hypothetical protein